MRSLGIFEKPLLHGRKRRTLFDKLSDAVAEVDGGVDWKLREFQAEAPFGIFNFILFHNRPVLVVDRPEIVGVGKVDGGKPDAREEVGSDFDEWLNGGIVCPEG